MNEFILVKAHTELGEAYLNYKCYEQSIDHLTVALKMNGRLFQNVEEAKLYHSHILNLLGKSYYLIGSREDAMELLLKSLEI